MAKQTIRATGVKCKGQGLVAGGIRGTAWEGKLFPGSLNLYIEGDYPGIGRNCVDTWRASSPDAGMPSGCIKCTVNGVAAMIVNRLYPQSFNAPSPDRKYTEGTSDEGASAVRCAEPQETLSK